MSKKPALGALVAQMKEGTASMMPPDSPGRATAGTPKKRGPRPPEQRHEPKSREGKKSATVFFPPEAHEELRRLAFLEKTSNQALIGEALDMLFRSRGRPTFGAR